MITEFLINSLADRISEDYISGKGDLSKLIAEAAKVNKFNEETIKRLVEASNIATFKRLYEAKAAANAPDRNIVFDLADFNKVMEILDEIDESESGGSESRSESQSLSASDIEKKYPDLKDNPLTPVIANIVPEVVSSLPGNVKHIKIQIVALKKASDDLAAVFEKLKHDYNSTLSDLATEFSRYNAYDLNKFASEILAISNDTRVDGEVLCDIYKLCKETPANIKISSDKYISLPRKEFDLFKKAADLFRRLEQIEDLKIQVDKKIKDAQSSNDV
ncbi:MAG: hypothetical protein ABIM30_00310 [candidate division WOR-3 bacterium]